MADYSRKFFGSLLAVFAFLVHGASDVAPDTVFAEKGDSVTLHTNITINQRYNVKWYFTDTLIAQINLSHICTDVQCNEGTERFRDRLELDHQTGDLTITNINTSDDGVYQLRIFSSLSIIRQVFDVDVHDVVAEMKKKSVKEGESVTLDTPEVEDLNDLMTWYFNDTLIAEITGDQHKICEDVQCKERFRDRLKLDQTGSLIITDTRTTDSGDYQLQIKSSRNHYSITSSKKFSVLVNNSGSPAVAGICVAVVAVVVLLVAAGVIYFWKKRSKKDEESPRDEGVPSRISGKILRHYSHLSEVPTSP